MLAAAVAYVGLDVVDVVPGVLTRHDPAAGASAGAPVPQTPSSGASTGPSIGASSGPSTGAPAGSAAGVGARLLTVDPTALPLAAPAATAPSPTSAALAARLAPLLQDPALGPSLGVQVLDGLSATALYGVDPLRPRAPASSAKLVTAAAIASLGGTSRTLDTAVVAGPGPGQIVLVAGGDTLLSPGAGVPNAVVGRAGLADLAAQVAQVLAGQPSSGATLLLDDAALTGPALAPTWASADVAAGYVGPVAALGLATQRPAPGWAAVADPALAAAEAFRAQLAAHGVTVAKPVARGKAQPGARTLGVVHSAPLSEVLSLALDDSDNTLTEALARVAAVRAGAAPTFAGVTGWVRDRLVAIGVPAAGLKLVDCSGLSAGTTVPAATLATIVALGTTAGLRDFAAVIARLPVAGLSGTLAGRYLSGPERAGAGLVRAKTGTLDGVASLTGTVVDADGRLLVFSVVADRVPSGATLAARVALDRIAASLAGCGCR